jgi:hypothetical protein
MLLKFYEVNYMPSGTTRGQADALTPSRIVIGGHSESDNPCGRRWVRSSLKAFWLTAVCGYAVCTYGVRMFQFNSSYFPNCFKLLIFVMTPCLL